MSCLSGRRPSSLLLAFLFLAAPLLAADQPVSPEEQRLISVAKLWVTVKYFHPFIASKALDWDQSLLDALPAIRSATTDSEFATAVRSLLATLNDPLTYASDSKTVPAVLDAGPSGSVHRVWMHHGLPSALASALGFYQAFLIKTGTPTETISLALSPTLRAQVRLSDEPSASDPTPHPKADSDYAASPYPSVELRILSAFRIWGTIHNFFAYKDLMDEDWDSIFADTLPKFIAASDARAYHLVVAEMISRLSDSNSTVQSGTLDRYFGEASPGVQVRLIEKKPVITEIVSASAREAGIRLGDVVTSVDGEKVTERFRREASYVSASTVQGLSAQVAARLLNGPDASSAALTVSGADDRSRTVSLKRSIRPADSRIAPAPERAVRILSTNIGYVDLTNLAPAGINAMFEKLSKTAAIIFDARGPIAPMASEIASCVASRPEITTSIVTGPLTLEPDLPRDGLSTTSSSYFSMEALRNSCPTPYRGKTVMLIDERTVGNAEHLGLALEAANNTEFLGTPSAGADSSVTEIAAPGGILIRFSGTDIRHANGGPIQRMGLQPSLALAPKIAAIRSGRDVVLEKTLEYLRPNATQAALNGPPALTEAW